MQTFPCSIDLNDFSKEVVAIFGRMTTVVINRDFEANVDTTYSLEGTGSLPMLSLTPCSMLLLTMVSSCCYSSVYKGGSIFGLEADQTFCPPTCCRKDYIHCIAFQYELPG